MLGRGDPHRLPLHPGRSRRPAGTGSAGSSRSPSRSSATSPSAGPAPHSGRSSADGPRPAHRAGRRRPRPARTRRAPVGGDVYAHRFDLTAGGGFNVMATAAHDNADVVYLGTVGTGSFGDKVRAALRAEHVTTPNPPVTGLDTGGSIAIVDDDAERTFLSTLGAEGHVTPEHLNAVTVRPDDVVYVTGTPCGIRSTAPH
ncbi:PfkB family carbohydrate kinase [Streptomyces sp. NPDC047000]|uniref:PfkB family carbohydrate kinase n=1 Tax=Streptomyces sp. NPDC047000 TaxID=3155474 RepID=UPI00341157AE